LLRVRFTCPPTYIYLPLDIYIIYIYYIEHKYIYIYVSYIYIYGIYNWGQGEDMSRTGHLVLDQSWQQPEEFSVWHPFSHCVWHPTECKHHHSHSVGEPDTTLSLPLILVGGRHSVEGPDTSPTKKSDFSGMTAFSRRTRHNSHSMQNISTRLPLSHFANLK
jgi:hypothetical protein